MKKVTGTHFWRNSVCCATYWVHKPTWSWYLKTFRNQTRKLARGINLIVMKLKPHVSCHLLDVYTGFQIHISKHVEKKYVKFSLAGNSINSPFREFLSTRGPKMTKISRGQGTHYQIWGLYITSKAMNADKWLWPIFGCKVGQSVQIGMKLKLDV